MSELQLRLLDSQSVAQIPTGTVVGIRHPITCYLGLRISGAVSIFEFSDAEFKGQQTEGSGGVSGTQLEGAES